LQHSQLFLSAGLLFAPSQIFPQRLGQPLFSRSPLGSLARGQGRIVAHLAMQRDCADAVKQ
jgi:hypothetical protein